MRHACRTLLVLAALVLATPALAHPHVWIKVTSELLYAADGRATAIRHRWEFDDIYSAFAVQGITPKVKGTFARAELAPVARDYIASLKQNGYFTFVTADGGAVALADPLPDYGLAYKDAILTLDFTVPFRQPVQAKELTVEIYDPAYYIAFAFAEGMPVRLVGKPARCKGTVAWPREMTLAEGRAFSANPEAAATWGAHFANRIAVQCL